MKVITLRVDDDLHERIKDEAWKQRTTMNALLCNILSRELAPVVDGTSVEWMARHLVPLGERIDGEIMCKQGLALRPHDTEYRDLTEKRSHEDERIDGEGKKEGGDE